MIVGKVVCISIIYEWANEGRYGGGRAESRMNMTNLIDSKLVFQINYSNIVRSSSAGLDREGMEKERRVGQSRRDFFLISADAEDSRELSTCAAFIRMKQEDVEVMNE